MGLLVRFDPALGTWLVQQLDGGRTPPDVVAMMQAQGMEARAAQAIVAAFVAARRQQRPLPVDAVELPEAEASVLPVSRLAPGARIAAADRQVAVLARAQDPLLAVLGGVLSADECAALIEMARPRLRPSTLVDPHSGRDVVSGARSSAGMFFRLGENPLIARLDRRLSALMNLPVENGEGLQVLHYPAGASSAPHFDFLQPSNAANQASLARSGQRVSTLVCYLNDVAAGGETVFPTSGWSISPQRGHAVYFEYCDAQGRVDARSLHAGAAVTQGEKWVATKWMRQRRFISAAEAGASA